MRDGALKGEMMVNRSRFLTVVASASLSLAGLAAPVHAHETAAGASTTFRYAEGQGKFQGRVVSSQARCERNRTVRVVEETPQGREFVGRDRTDSEGRWRVPGDNANGAYRAIVKRRVGRNDQPRHIHICEGAESSTVTVNP